MKSQLIGKDPDAGKDWRQKEERVAEEVMLRQQHPLNGHDFEQTPGNSGGEGSPGCSPWGLRELDKPVTE